MKPKQNKYMIKNPIEENDRKIFLQRYITAERLIEHLKGKIEIPTEKKLQEYDQNELTLEPKALGRWGDSPPKIAVWCWHQAVKQPEDATRGKENWALWAAHAQCEFMIETTQGDIYDELNKAEPEWTIGNVEYVQEPDKNKQLSPEQQIFEKGRWFETENEFRCVIKNDKEAERKPIEFAPTIIKRIVFGGPVQRVIEHLLCKSILNTCKKTCRSSAGTFDGDVIGLRYIDWLRITDFIESSNKLMETHYARIKPIEKAILAIIKADKQHELGEPWASLGKSRKANAIKSAFSDWSRYKNSLLDILEEK